MQIQSKFLVLEWHSLKISCIWQSCPNVARILELVDSGWIWFIPLWCDGAIRFVVFQNPDSLVCIRSPWRQSEFFMKVDCHILDRLWQNTVFLADGHFILRAPIVFWCHWSSD